MRRSFVSNSSSSSFILPGYTDPNRVKNALRWLVTAYSAATGKEMHLDDILFAENVAKEDIERHIGKLPYEEVNDVLSRISDTCVIVCSIRENSIPEYIQYFLVDVMDGYGIHHWR